MISDTRFGLPLAFSDALRAARRSRAATATGARLQGEGAAAGLLRSRGGHAWRAAVAGMVMAVGFGSQGYAATSSLEGRWTMASRSSSFQESITGPAPDTATVTVTQDDRDRLVYDLVESRRGAEVARGAYDISFAGAPSTSQVDGSVLEVSATRDARGDVVIRAPAVGTSQATIHVRRTGPDTALLEHDIEGADGATTLEAISLVRVGSSSN
jgi:hypothetical protein